MKIVKVIWEGNKWISSQDVLKVYADANFIQNSYGALIYENDKDIILAQSVDEEDGSQDRYANCLRIPKVIIIEIIELEEK